MRNQEINKKDFVRLKRNLKPHQKEKLFKFIRKQCGNSYLSAFRELRTNSYVMKVRRISFTPQTNTKYAVLEVFEVDSIERVTKSSYPNFVVAIQSRYLKLLQKHCSHPLTKIFM